MLYAQESLPEAGFCYGTTLSSNSIGIIPQEQCYRYIPDLPSRTYIQLYVDSNLSWNLPQAISHRPAFHGDEGYSSDNMNTPVANTLQHHVTSPLNSVRTPCYYVDTPPQFVYTA